MRSTCVVVFLVAAVWLGGYSLYETSSVGNFLDGFDARSAAMGGGSVCAPQDALGMLTNPALASRGDDWIRAQLAVKFLRDDDSRSIPMFDSFDSVVDEGTYVTNANSYAMFAAAVSMRHRTGFGTFGFGLHLRPLMSFEADYEEEIRSDANSDNNTYPPVIARNFITGEGDLKAWGLTLSFMKEPTPFCDRGSFGLGVEMVDGSRDRSREIIWSETAQSLVTGFELPDYLYTEHQDLSGIRLTAGVRVDVNPRFGFGLTYVPVVTLDTTAEVNGLEMDDVVDWKLPATISAGMLFRPRNILRTTVAMDMELRSWSDVDEQLDDVLILSLGVEHSVVHRIPLRFGFRWENSPLDENIAKPTFTAGTGYQFLDRYNWDIAFSYASRTFEQPDLFPDGYYNDENYTPNPVDYVSPIWAYRTPMDRDAAILDKVDEAVIGVTTSISVSW